MSEEINLEKTPSPVNDSGKSKKVKKKKKTSKILTGVTESESMDESELSPIVVDEPTSIIIDGPALNLAGHEVAPLMVPFDAVKELFDQMRAICAKMSSPNNIREKRFKVPNKHPIFDGKPEHLEAFLSKMIMSHVDWVTGEAADQHCPHFISKLVDYFSEKSGIQTWFTNYVTEQVNEEGNLTWNNLVKVLREDFSPKKQREQLFIDFWSIQQDEDEIQGYIARIKKAYAQAKSMITEELLLVKFTSGLRVDVKRHVNVLEPISFEKAVKLAIAYESNNQKPAKKIGPTNSRDTKRFEGGSTSALTNKRAHANSNKENMNSTQRKALEDLQNLRRSKCFACGEAGHSKWKCTASVEDKSRHEAKVRLLKTQISNNTESKS